MLRRFLNLIIIVACIYLCVGKAQAYEYVIDGVVHESTDQITKDLDNPLSDLINMPVQLNWDYGGGPKDKGEHTYLKFEPVIPMQILGNWRIISRSIISVENKHNFGYESKTGLSDLSQTFFISPTFHDEAFKWGAGVAFLLPTATEKQLGSDKWGAGPSFVITNEWPDWTVGFLARHIWSFAGDDDRSDVDETYLQPFVSYRFKNAWSAKLTSEYSYDWRAREATTPVNLTISKVIDFGNHPLNFAIGGRYYINSPDEKADWGLRATITFVFPRYIKNFVERRIIHHD